MSASLLSRWPRWSLPRSWVPGAAEHAEGVAKIDVEIDLGVRVGARRVARSAVTTGPRCTTTSSARVGASARLKSKRPWSARSWPLSCRLSGVRLSWACRWPPGAGRRGPGSAAGRPGTAGARPVGAQLRVPVAVMRPWPAWASNCSSRALSPSSLSRMRPSPTSTPCSAWRTERPSPSTWPVQAGRRAGR